MSLGTETRPFRILAIDGGGMKGVFACSYLHALEEHFSKKLVTHFDMIAGTSTGGIIALGIAAGKTAGQLGSFYREHGPDIFPDPRSLRLPIVKQLKALLDNWTRLNKGYWYQAEPLRKALASVLADECGTPLLMNSAATRLIIPAVNAQSAFPRVFKAHRGEPQVKHLDRDMDIPMIDVALATAAAPWYLPIAKVSEAGMPFTYIDGGLWANNPAVVAITEALTYYVGDERDYDCIQMLSIALPSSAGFRNDGEYMRGTQFVHQLLSYSMEASKHGADKTAEFLLRAKPNTYHRVRPKNLTEDESDRLQLDSANPEDIGELLMLGNQQAHLEKGMPELQAVFG